jgi:O-antigen/teichoic acid export membrane protein
VGGVSDVVLEDFLTKSIKDDVTRNSIIMVGAGVISAIFNYLYQVSLGWLLSPEDYGTVVSLLSVLVIISVFASTIDTTVTSFVSRETSSNRNGSIQYLWKYFLKRTLLIGLGVFILVGLLSPVISKFLNISSNWYCIILFSSVVFAFAFCVNTGTLRGLQRFVPLGISSALWTTFKFILGFSLVYAGFKVSGALFAIVLAYAAVFLVSLFFLRDLFRTPGRKAVVKGVQSYALFSLFSFLAFALITSMDVILAKHYLSPSDAGSYSAVSILGKLAIYLPAGVATAMFPQIAQLSEAKLTYGKVLIKALGLTVLIAGGIVIFYWVFPGFVTNVLFRGNYPSIGPFLVRYGLAMAFFAIANLLTSYLLSVKQTGVAYPLAATVVVQITLIVLFHSDISQIINMLVISGAASLIFLTIYFVFLRRRNALSNFARV